MQLPLSYAQEGLWFLDQFGMGRAAYNVRTLLRLKGPLDRAALARALNVIVARHEPLRTHFPSIDGVPYQVVAPPAPVDLRVEDARSLPLADREARARTISHEERETPFDLAHGPVTRARLLQLDDEDHLFAWTCHHIALDGWSRGVFHHELGALYDAFHAGRDNPLPPLPIQYADVARWQRADPGGEMAGGLEYWTKQLADMPERLTLPTDRPRPSVQTFVAGLHELVVAPDVMVQLRQITAAARATLYMSMLAALAMLLARYSGQADIIVGSTIANRQDPDVELLIGLFVNRLVMRVRLQRDLTFRQLLASVRQTTLDAYRHQNVPFERIVEALAPQRRVDMTPLVQVSFAFQNAPWVPPQLSQLDTTFAMEPTLVRTDLELHAFERSGSFHLGWIYNEDLFDRPRIEQMARHYMRMLGELAANPDVVIGQLPLLDRSERHAILTAWNQTEAPSVPATIPELFQREARRRPDAVAVVVGDDDQWTYAGLARRAHGIARRLRELGVGPEARVGLCADRSASMIAAVIGITQVGAAYLPIEPRLPRDRRAALLEAAGASVLLTDVAVSDSWPANVVVVDLDDRRNERAADAERETSAPLPRPAQAAYVLYTSGTTGKPKGVVVQHGQVVNYIEGVYARVPGLDSGARCAMVQPLAVDSSVLMLYSALFSGGRLYLVPSDLATDPIAYPLYSIRHGIEFLKIAPSHLAALETNTAASSLPRHTVIVGGEASPAAWMASLKTSAPCEVFNHYGPTETTVGVVMYRVGPPESIGHTVPIGRPLANVRAYIVDATLEPVPIGVAGELLIAGTNVARGYLHQPALTAARFVADPFGPAGSRVYRTGDFARWRADGAIEFLGRTDDQIKIRGFRVELGEIETGLRRSREVQDAMVLLRGERSNAQLVAYVVRRPTEVDRDLARKARLEEWQQLYEDHRRNEGQASDFNILGWDSSYTQAPLPAAEMRIWIEQTVARLRALAPRRVLEIRCGTGLLLTRVAPLCDRYVATDVAQSVLTQLGEYRARRADLAHVELYERQAHDASFLADDSVDLVVMNSVVQYFPDVDYLLEVVSEALRVTRSGGHVFIGDVRSLPLLEAYHASVQLFRAADTADVAELRGRVARAVRHEEELVLDPKLFQELGRRWPKVGAVRFAPKEGAYSNELSRFRYDVTLQVGSSVVAVPPKHWVPWDQLQRWRADVDARLVARPDDAIGVRGFRDRRLAPVIAECGALAAADASRTAADVRAAADPAPSEDPDDVMQWAARQGMTLDWEADDDSGCWDVVVNRRWRPAEPLSQMPVPFYRQWGNAPASGADDAALGRRLLETLRRKLPDYMVPSAVVVLPAWPLTRHGKVDRARLPAPDRPFVTTAGREPRTPEEEILCELVADVLGLPHVGVDDDFFALGGHSLLATRLVSRIHALLDDQVPIRAVFETPTVAGLAHHLHGARGSRPPLRATPRTGPVPASYAQQRLCFHDQFAGGSAEYNLSRVLRVRGRLDRDALARALTAIVARHEPLRTCFRVVDGVPFQEVAGPSELELRIEDLRRHPAAEREERAQDRVRAERERPFDLWRGPVVRASLLQLADDEHVLVWICHHVASDGWSRGVFHRELTALYDAFHGGRDDPLPPLPVQYTDFVQWQRAWLGDGTLDEGLAYWTRQLADLPEPLMLPTDRPRPSVQTVSAGHHSMTIAADQLGALEQVGQSHRSTLYMVLLTGLAVLLARYTDRHDIVVGSPVANRQDAQLENLIGLLVNSLVMRIRVPLGATFARLLADVRRITLEAYRHQDTPFERIVEALQPERTLNVTPLFQVLLVVQNTPSAPVALADLDVEPLVVEATRVRYDLEIHVQEHEGALVVYWAYNRDLFDHWRIVQMAAHYTQVLETIATRPSSKVDELTLAAVDGAAVRHDVAPVHEWLPPVTALFDQQAARTPDAIAIACGDLAITYEDARERVQRVARRLVARGIQPGDIVAAWLERSELVPMVVLGIFQARAIYAPIDSRQPAHRLRAVLDAARPALLLRTESTTAADGFPSVSVDALLPSAAGALETGARADREPSVSEAAYVMYTSGSSGTPNGVIVSHASLTASLRGMRDCLPLGPGDRQLAATTFTFDPSLVEILLPLCHGASVIMARSEDVATPAGMCALIRRSQATSIQATPSYWNVLLEHDADALRGRRAFSGGEPLTGDLARALTEAEALVHNLYGPTETTMWATAHRVGDGDLAAATLPIGRALTGYRLSVLDSALRVVPPGVPGEIYIAGDGPAFGYLGRPGLSACRFVASVDGVESGGRMYRTGDIAMCRPDGALQFLGRRDTQVKMRGVRIELGEVEAAVRREAAVRDAVVLVQGEGATRHLVAYVERAAVLRGGARAQTIESDDLDETTFSGRLLDALRHVLPDYMVPSSVVVMPQWPLTATGKINRRALPEAALPAHDRQCDVAGTPEEEALCELFARVLGLPHVGVNDDFFALGGHSLLAMRLVTRLCARLGVNVPLRVVFDSPTVAGLATWLAAR